MTIVERVTIPVKLNKADELVEIIRQAKSWYEERNLPLRVCTAYQAQYDVVVVETDYASLADLEKFDIEFWADPLIQSLIPKWLGIVERGRSSESWVLHDI